VTSSPISHSLSFAFPQIRDKFQISLSLIRFFSYRRPTGCPNRGWLGHGLNWSLSLPFLFSTALIYLSHLLQIVHYLCSLCTLAFGLLAFGLKVWKWDGHGATCLLCSIDASKINCSRFLKRSRLRLDRGSWCIYRRERFDASNSSFSRTEFLLLKISTYMKCTSLGTLDNFRVLIPWHFLNVMSCTRVKDFAFATKTLLGNEQ
jgi:hypothetical protein